MNKNKLIELLSTLDDNARTFKEKAVDTKSTPHAFYLMGKTEGLQMAIRRLHALLE